MKSLKISILPLLFLVVCLTSCNEKNTDGSTQSPVKKSDTNFTVGYNENIETLALIYNLSESGDWHFNEIIGHRGILAEELTKQFEDFRDHEAVKKLNKLLNDGFVDTYGIILSLYNTQLPEFRQFAKYPSIYYENEGLTAKETQARFDDFNKSVIEFYKDANLKNHFKNKYKDLYKKIMDESSSVIPNETFIKEAEAYYGLQRDSYEIILSAFSFNGIGRANLISSKNANIAVSLVTSNPNLESDTINVDDLSSFTVGYNDADYFQEVGIHELIHTFYHEALKENKSNIELINDLNYLFTDSLKKDMMNQGYTDWRTCFEEHLVRIGEIKMAAKLGDNEFIDRYRNKCINERGFIYFELIENIFYEYENNRSKYANIGDFIPELVKEIKRKVPNNVYKK